MSAADRRREVRALQAALEGVEAVMWGYGVAGARMDGDDAVRAQRAFEEYRALRDRLRRQLRARSAEPTPGRASYELPFPVRTGSDARRLAVRLEVGASAQFAEVVAAARGQGLRAFGAEQLGRAVRRARDWGWSPVAFPGLPELRPAGG